MGLVLKPVGLAGWREALAELQRRVGELFGRPEPRRQAGLYLEGARPSARTAGSWPKRLGTAARGAPNGFCRMSCGTRTRRATCAAIMWSSTWARRADHRRDRVLEEGNPVGRRGAPVFRDGGAGRELPDRCFPGLRQCKGSRPDRP